MLGNKMQAQSKAIVLKLLDGTEALASADGRLIIGLEKDLKYVFGTSFSYVVPISLNMTIPVVHIRQHAAYLFEGEDA